MFTLVLAASLAAPNPARSEPPSLIGLQVLRRPTDAPAPPHKPDASLTPISALTGPEFPVMAERPGRVLLRHKGTDVWVARHDVWSAKEALAYYNSIVASAPTPNNYILRAKAHELAFDWDAAIKDYDEAIKQTPQTYASWNNRANFYSRKRDYQKALEGYDEAIKLSPNAPIPLSNRANTFINLREWDKALEGFDRSLKASPGYGRAYAGKAAAYREKRQFDLAMNAAERGVELEPTSQHTLLARGQCYAARNEHDKAFDDFEEALRQDPLLAAGYVGRAGVFIVRKEYQKAIRDCDTAMRLAPRYAAAMVRRAEAWLAAGNVPRAILDLDEAIAADDKYPVSHREKAWLLSTHADDKIRDGASALDLAKKAQTLSKTETPEYWETLAAAYAETGDFAKAVEWQKKAASDAGYVKEKGERVKKRLEMYEGGKAWRE